MKIHYEKHKIKVLLQMKCKDCDLSFGSNKAPRTHNLFKCSHCIKQFTRKESVNTHIKACHTDTKNFSAGPVLHEENVIDNNDSTDEVFKEYLKEAEKEIA